MVGNQFSSIDRPRYRPTDKVRQLALLMVRTIAPLYALMGETRTTCATSYTPEPRHRRSAAEQLRDVEGLVRVCHYRMRSGQG